MLQLVKRLAGLFRSSPQKQAEPAPDRPSWRPGTPTPEPLAEPPKRFSTLLPGSTPRLDAAGLVENEPKDDSK